MAVIYHYFSYSRYAAMGTALQAAGRGILYSICNWGQDSPWDWGPSTGNSWRIAGDIVDNYNKMSPNCAMCVSKLS